MNPMAQVSHAGYAIYPMAHVSHVNPAYLEAHEHKHAVFVMSDVTDSAWMLQWVVDVHGEQSG